MHTKTILLFAGLVLIFFGTLLAAQKTEAASLSVSPTTGTFEVGSTFNVSIFLDTEEESINAIEASLQFPPDKIQVVSPSAGQSIISLWLSSPKFNNQTGTLKLKGGVPGGINVSRGLVSTLTFRVKGVGQGVIKFLDDSRVLLNDGSGTDALEQVQNGVYQFVLPPPAGPIVVSQSHPNQSRWYPNPTLILKWARESEVESYSYILSSDEPVHIPDDVSEGVKSSVVYRSLADGKSYFHIKALRDGAWGGTTHFVANIDATPPAEFPISISPSKRSTERSPVIQFETTDATSGIDYYELKVIPLTQGTKVIDSGDQPLFIEVESPFIIPQMELGTYDIIVRAYDKAGNHREVTEHLKIVIPIFKSISDRGLEIKGIIIIPWIWLWIIGGIILAILGYLAWHFRKWHHNIRIQKAEEELPFQIKRQLKELKEYRKKYGKVLSIFLLLGTMFIFGSGAFAQQVELGPPLINTISRNISNEEIFYIGGKTETANSDVIIYLQNLQTGETLSQTVTSDKLGDWFYRHNVFLSSGNYLLWVQSKVAEELSPPSPQIQLTVRPTAIQFGASRISYETFYLGIFIILSLAVAGLIIYIVFHVYHGRKKRKELTKEIKEAEESVRRGFAVLRRDIEAELAIIKRAKLSRALSAEQKANEEQLLKDLRWAERYIGKEVWDIEKTEQGD